MRYFSGETTDSYGPPLYTLDRVHPNDIGHNKETGNPKVYAVWADTLEIWPIPRSDQSGTTLYVYLVDIPSGVTATSSPIETPAYFDITVLHYVLAKAFYKDRNIVQGDKYMALFDMRIKEYLANVIRRTPIE